MGNVIVSPRLTFHTRRLACIRYKGIDCRVRILLEEIKSTARQRFASLDRVKEARTSVPAMVAHSTGRSRFPHHRQVPLAGVRSCKRGILGPEPVHSLNMPSSPAPRFSLLFHWLVMSYSGGMSYTFVRDMSTLILKENGS